MVLYLDVVYYELLQVSAAESFKKFVDAVRSQTWGTELVANDFEAGLWTSIFKRINFECAMNERRKNRRPALNIGIKYQYKEDLEVVYPDAVFGKDGLIKDDPLHVFVPDIIDIPYTSDSKIKDGGMKQFLKMLQPPYTCSDPEVRRTQVLSLTAALPISFYGFVVVQANGCPTLSNASKETSTDKTTTNKLALTIYSDPAYFLDQKSSEGSYLKLKSKTSTPIVLDDVESAALKHRINLNNYNAGNKMTLERGSEKPMAGVITSENLKSEEQIPEKDDEGRKMFIIFDKRIVDDIEDAFEAEAEHIQKMADPTLCRNFLAEMAEYFLPEPEKVMTTFQEKLQAALIELLKPSLNMDTGK